MSQEIKSFNNNWHEYQIDEQYRENISINQKLTVNTTFDNNYIFVRAWDYTNDILLDPTLNLWEFTKNNRPTYIDDNPALGRINVKISIIDELISYFYGLAAANALVGGKKELPIDITIN